MKTTSNDLGIGSQDDVFIDSDIGVVADMGVQAAMEFLTADKVIVSHEDVKEEKNKIILYFKIEYTIYVDDHLGLPHIQSCIYYDML